MSRNIAGFWFLVILLVASSFAIVACNIRIIPYEPAINIRIHNQTDEALQIFIDGEVYIGRASPGGEVVWEIERNQPNYKITAKDMDGNTVYVVTWTRNDLKGKYTYDVYFPPKETETESSDNITGK